MARPITLCTAQWADLPLDELCRVAKQMGYEGLELATWGPIDVKRASEDLEYVKEVKDTLAKHGLGCWAIAAHVPGQCVADLWDPRLDGFAPAECSESRADPQVGHRADDADREGRTTWASRSSPASWEPDLQVLYSFRRPRGHG